jgi:hypothetical protein
MADVIFIQIPREALVDEIRRAVKLSLSEYDKEKSHLSDDRCYTVNQVAKRLKKAHSTVKKLCQEGHLKSTSSGTIPEWAINEYLGKQI